MATIGYSNFDSETTGAVPAGWVDITGTSAVVTTNPISGTKAYGSSTKTDDVALYASGITAIGDMGIQFSQKVPTITSSNQALPMIGFVLRADASYTKGYVVLITGISTTNIELTFFSRVSNAYAIIPGAGVVFNVPIALVSGATLWGRVTVVGTKLSVYFATGAWPNFSSTAGTTLTDSSVTGTGFVGRFYGTNGYTTPPMSLDDFEFDDGVYGAAVAVTDTNWKFSPYNWLVASGAATAVNGGAYFKLGFTGTYVSITFDFSSLVAGSVNGSWYPIIRYSVDDGPLTDVQLDVTKPTLLLGGLASGTHTLFLSFLAGWWENNGGTAPDRWTTPVYCLKVTAAALDPGAATAAPTLRSKRMIFFGDSIPEGIRSTGLTTQPANQNSYDAVPALLALSMDCEYGNCSFGGQAFEAGFGNIPAFNSAYGYYFGTNSRLVSGVLSPAPDYVFVWLGTNGTPTSTNVQTAVGNMRTIAPTAIITIIVPVGGFGRTAILAGVAAYLAANTSERKVWVLDLGTNFQTGLSAFNSGTAQAVDGVHPRASWHGRIAAGISGLFRSKYALRANSRTVTGTVKNAANSTVVSETGLAWAFFDSATVDVASVPADTGIGASTDSSGVITLTNVNSSLASGGIGTLVLSKSDGTTTQSPAPKLGGGPVAVS